MPPNPSVARLGVLAALPASAEVVVRERDNGVVVIAAIITGGEIIVITNGEIIVPNAKRCACAHGRQTAT
jgi:hypothetical protein